LGEDENNTKELEENAEIKKKVDYEIKIKKGRPKKECNKLKFPFPDIANLNNNIIANDDVSEKEKTKKKRGEELVIEQNVNNVDDYEENVKEKWKGGRKKEFFVNQNENIIADLDLKVNYKIYVKVIFVTCCENEVFSPNDINNLGKYKDSCYILSLTDEMKKKIEITHTHLISFFFFFI
jgi:hypothetical protein